MNMRQFTNKLPVKISFCLFLFVCIPMLICNLGLQLYLKSNIVRNTTFAFENAAVNIENTFENVFSEIGITLNLLSTDPALYNTLESSPESFNEELKRKISVDSLTAQYQQHILYCTVDFLILDASDRLYSTYYIQDQDTLLQNLNLHCRPQIQENDLNFSFFSISMDYLGGNADTPVICVGKSIRNYKRQYLGLALAIIDEKKLYNIIEKSSLYPNSINLLTTEDDIVISARDKSMIGMSLSELIEEPDSYLIQEHQVSNHWTLTSAILKKDLYQSLPVSQFFIFLNLGITFVFMAIIFYIISFFLKPVRTLKELMSKVEDHDLDVRFLPESNDELSELGISFNHMLEKINSLFKRTQEQQKKLLEQENEKERYRYMVLQSQINPHLTFNTLNNIKWTALINQDTQAADMIASFGKLLEKTLKSSEDYFTIREELAYIQEYVNLMQPHTLKGVHLETYIESPDLSDCLILKLLFQPIVENSILHGFNDDITKPSIMISIRSREDSLICRISDNGIGISEEKLKTVLDLAPGGNLSRSIGIPNIAERLHLFYGEKAEFSIDSTEYEGTTVTFILPAKI